MSELFLRLVFSYVVGNSNMHLKNFSLIEDNPGSQKYILSPAYDLLPVNAILPEDNEEFALAINGKKTNIRKKDFLVFADEVGINMSAANKIIQNIISLKDIYINMCNDSYLPDNLKIRLIDIIEKRINVLIV